MPKRVLFVCTGNLCRSPMAAALSRHRLGDAVVADSVGLMAAPGRPIDPRAAAVLTTRGIALLPHASRQLTVADVDRAGLVLAMEHRQLSALRALAPDARDKTFLLGRWHGDVEIPDPYGRDERAFEECCELIDDALARWQSQIITSN